MSILSASNPTKQATSNGWNLRLMLKVLRQGVVGYPVLEGLHMIIEKLFKGRNGSGRTF
jgi:hypothetical protein